MPRSRSWTRCVRRPRSELSRTLSDLQAAAERLRRYDESLLVEAKKAVDSVEFRLQRTAQLE